MHRDERVTSVLLQACAPVNEKKNAVRMKARPLWCLPACKAQFKPFRTPPTPQTKLALAWGGPRGVHGNQLGIVTLCNPTRGGDAYSESYVCCAQSCCPRPAAFHPSIKSHHVILGCGSVFYANCACAAAMEEELQRFHRWLIMCGGVVLIRDSPPRSTSSFSTPKSTSAAPPLNYFQHRPNTVCI